LRSNNWIPRREENTPKTFGEVHAEALAKQIQDEIFSETKSPSTTIETKGKNFTKFLNGEEGSKFKEKEKIKIKERSNKKIDRG